MNSLSGYKNLRIASYVVMVGSICVIIASVIYLFPVLFLNFVCGFYSNSCIDVSGPIATILISAFLLGGSIFSVVVCNNKIHELENLERLARKRAES
jgi:hypothetical protein